MSSNKHTIQGRRSSENTLDERVIQDRAGSKSVYNITTEKEVHKGHKRYLYKMRKCTYQTNDAHVHFISFAQLLLFLLSSNRTGLLIGDYFKKGPTDKFHKVFWVCF